MVAETTGPVAGGGIAEAGNSVFDLNTLLGAGIGAVLVFLFTEVREARQRSRERPGLAKLLNAEIGQNSHVLRLFDPTAEVEHGWSGQYLPLTREAWEECRVKMAQLADRGAFDALEVYYRELQQLTQVRASGLVAHDPHQVDHVREEVRSRIWNLEGLQIRASAAMQAYIAPPWYERWFGFRPRRAPDRGDTV